MALYPTPHINAAPEDFAATVLMPGDPLRAKFIAENFLTGAKLVNNVRGIQGYTGQYEGTRVSVCIADKIMCSLSVIMTERVRLPQETSIVRPASFASCTIRLTGAESGLTTAIMRSDATIFPKPMLMNFISPPFYSMFCICSLIFSSSHLTATTVCAASAFWHFEPIVFISRFISCMRKSSLRPAGSVASSIS